MKHYDRVAEIRDILFEPSRLKQEYERDCKVTGYGFSHMGGDPMSGYLCRQGQAGRHHG